jgi:UDP-glucose:(heptosyl)LPS alpha-1,3-glucosyltransferase
MKIALCYESVLPARGGCETYIADLSRRLVADRHEVQLFACRWDETALPAGIKYHAIPNQRGPRFLRPWRFGAACLRALAESSHDVSIGFDKTWGQDVLYPQGGLHAASTAHNFYKHSNAAARLLARMAKGLDLAHWSYSALERKQYLGTRPPLIVVNSDMVRRHFQTFYGVGSERLRVVHSAIDPARFAVPDRPRLRMEWRKKWRLENDDVVALFVAMNYHLKGLEPLLHAVAQMCDGSRFRLVVAGNPKTGSYERLARKLGIADRVRFLGPRRDVHHCYFAVDFLVHPTFYDPCSLVVLEGLACGLPVITSRFNGACELLHPPEAGLVISDPHDHSALAQCLTEFLDPMRRSRASEAARRAATRCTFEQHYQQLLSVFTEAAARRVAA